AVVAQEARGHLGAAGVVDAHEQRGVQGGVHAPSLRAVNPDARAGDACSGDVHTENAGGRPGIPGALRGLRSDQALREARKDVIAVYSATARPASSSQAPIPVLTPSVPST